MKKTATDQIENLDVSLFKSIPSQTTEDDRQALLAVQRATGRHHQNMVYLELGSHLGGSILPYLQDPRCQKIYSIDPRPLEQPDNAAPGGLAFYKDNSTEAMLARLRQIEPEAVSKIQCFESDASEVDPEKIDLAPHVVFVDGEHTNNAVLSDFHLCGRVCREGGTIVFHDADIVAEAISEICRGLEGEHREHLAFPLKGTVFAIFFDKKLVETDSFLKHAYESHLARQSRERVKKWLPPGALNLYRRIRDFANK